MRIGIIGNGFVGKATQQLSCDAISTYVYDVRPELCIPRGLTLDKMAECDIIFVCVPTPMEASGKCHLGIVESVLKQLRPFIDPAKNFVVVRSTVPVGTCDKLKCYFMPEFLTEKNFLTDFYNCPQWVFGVLENEHDATFRMRVTILLSLAKIANRISSDDVQFRTNKEAEMIKYVRNCYLASKVSFFNEMAEFCEKKGVDYEQVRSFAVLDSRIGESHTMVPGHDGKRGYGGTCFPKDTSSLLHQMSDVRMKSYVLKGAVTRNEQVDRKEKDWAEDKGRAVI